MTNASEENRQPVLDAPSCPSWCIDHFDIDRGHPQDWSVVHRSSEVTPAPGATVWVERFDLVSRGRPGAVTVRLNDENLTQQQATALAGALATAAATDGPEATVVRRMTLPEGMDYVVFEDANVVAIASQLEGQSFERALSRAGVR